MKPPGPTSGRARSAPFLYELGLTCAAMGAHAAAIDALRQALQQRPGYAAAALRLERLLRPVGGAERATASDGERVVLSPAKIAKAEQSVRDVIGDATPREASGLLQAHLMAFPTDFAALRMLAQLGLRAGQYAAMEKLLERALELSPGYLVARQNYAFVLVAQNKATKAVPHIDRLLAQDPGDKVYRGLRAKALTILGDYDEALKIFEELRSNDAEPGAGLWLSYGHALKYVGRRAESVRAYRNCIARAPTMGEAYWGIANLKTEPFSVAEIQAMRAQLAGEALSAQDRIAMSYALGSGLEQICEYEDSFTHYADGAVLKRAQTGYSANAFSAEMRRAAAFFTAPRLAGAAESGCPDPAPIFIVGLPRSGSTLVEQILASHSLVEGTKELPLIGRLVREVAGARSHYPEMLASLKGSELTALGDRYLQESRVYRKTGKPFFIDKMPSNWAHAAFIHLILPNAKIIDVRREPMANCFSAFKQLFANGVSYSYDLDDLGQYYKDYASFMEHVERVLPGRVHRVLYEDLVADAERETRRLLTYCGLAFEPACMRFWENARAVATPSSEQVRQPIFREGLDQWRHYEPWLEKLRLALG